MTPGRWLWVAAGIVVLEGLIVIGLVHMARAWGSFRDAIVAVHEENLIIRRELAKAANRCTLHEPPKDYPLDAEDVA